VALLENVGEQFKLTLASLAPNYGGLAPVPSSDTPMFLPAAETLFLLAVGASQISVPMLCINQIGSDVII